jgi:hypothetical protein
MHVYTAGHQTQVDRLGRRREERTLSKLNKGLSWPILSDKKHCVCTTCPPYLPGHPTLRRRYMEPFALLQCRAVSGHINKCRPEDPQREGSAWRPITSFPWCSDLSLTACTQDISSILKLEQLIALRWTDGVASSVLVQVNCGLVPSFLMAPILPPVLKVKYATFYWSMPQNFHWSYTFLKLRMKLRMVHNYMVNMFSSIFKKMCHKQRHCLVLGIQL